MNHSNYQEHEEDGESNWLVSYADLMTLLWGFFVILASLSKPDASKIEKMKEQTAKAMGGKYSHPYNKLSDELKIVIKKLELEQFAQVEKLVDGIQISIESTSFFNSAEASLLPDAKNVLGQISKALVPYSKDNLVYIEGHTDDLPINNLKFKNNWELSAKRATEVLELFVQQGLTEKNLRPIGFADTQPIAQIQQGRSIAHDLRAKNRRVVIRLEKIIDFKDQRVEKK